MIDRRMFIHSVGSAALAAMVPLGASTLERKALPRRAIPGGGFGRLPDIDQRQRMEAVIRALM